MIILFFSTFKYHVCCPLKGNRDGCFFLIFRVYYQSEARELRAKVQQKNDICKFF